MIRTLLPEDHLMLRRVSEPLEEGDPELIWDLFDTMRENAGVGLAAVQIGILRQIAVVECCEISTALINPEILERSTYTDLGFEGCLSLPGKVYKVERPIFIVARWTNQFGARRTYPLYGLPARVVQHEIDHMYGKLVSDYDPKPTDIMYGMAES